MIKGDRDIPTLAPTTEVSFHTRFPKKRPHLNLALVALALAPAVLACGRPPSGSRPVERTASATSRSGDNFDQNADPETRELIRRGEKIIEERRDCIILDLSQEVVSLRRGVPTYVERPIRTDDPQIGKIMGFRAANTDILREAANDIKDASEPVQATELRDTYFALAKTDLELSKRYGGTVRADLIDSVKCWIVKHLSLGVILNDLRDSNRDRNNRNRVSWVSGTKI